MPEMKLGSACELNHLLKVVDSELSAGREKGDPTEQKLRVSLDDRELWSKFKELTNEMIVTKSGRRMFPVLRCSVSGLDPNAMYSFLIDFVAVDSHRWKYVNGDWVPGGKAEPAAQNAVYIHPDSPNFGAHWMKEPVSFSKVKLTNKMHGNGQIMLNSLHKYQPRVHIVKVGSREEKRTISTHSFPETQFVAVTAYQNEEITALKIKYNPFAKAFQDAKERPDQRDFTSSFDDLGDPEQKRLSHFPGAWFLPPSSHALMPPPAHQFQSSLGLATHPCERFTLREHRHSPYTHPFHRRSPPHGTYHDVSANLPVLNIADNWTTHMSAAGHPHTSMLTAGNTPGAHQTQYMWNLSPAANQSCAVSQYIRSSTASSSPYLPPTPDTPSTISVTAGDHASHAYTQEAHAHAHAQQQVDNTASSFHSPGREARNTAAGSWSPLTPPPL